MSRPFLFNKDVILLYFSHGPHRLTSGFKCRTMSERYKCFPVLGGLTAEKLDGAYGSSRVGAGLGYQPTES